jgi:hypothetical protein
MLMTAYGHRCIDPAKEHRQNRGMSIFANKRTSIFAIKKENKEFSKWWDRWLERVQGTRTGRDKNGAEIDGRNAERAPQALHFLNRVRLRQDL